MDIVKAPRSWSTALQQVIFLAGSIEMGVAENWQDKVANALEDENILILNPRRDDWDSSWAQSIDNPQFREQVEWELNGLERADIVVMYFDKDTKSPITLLELGLLAIARRHNGGLIVCCPEGFWRKGNVDIVCKRYGIKQVNTIEQLVESVIKVLNNKDWQEVQE